MSNLMSNAIEASKDQWLDTVSERLETAHSRGESVDDPPIMGLPNALRALRELQDSLLSEEAAHLLADAALLAIAETVSPEAVNLYRAIESDFWYS